MIDQNILRLIADAGELSPADVVLEVGPGVGNLTRILSGRAGAVLAVDIDVKLLAAASAHAGAIPNVQWLAADVLAGKHQVNADVQVALTKLITEHRASEYKLVSNLPYNIAGPLVAELLVDTWRSVNGVVAAGTDDGRTSEAPALPPACSMLAFTVQYEMAQRMRATAGTDNYGPLGVIIQLLAKVEILREIPRQCFWPPPKVKSALVRVTADVPRMRQLNNVPQLQALISGIFAYRRQRLGNAVKHYLEAAGLAGTPDLVAAAGLDLSLRPEVLTPEDFVRMAQALA